MENGRQKNKIKETKQEQRNKTFRGIDMKTGKSLGKKKHKTRDKEIDKVIIARQHKTETDKENRKQGNTGKKSKW